MIRHQIIRRLSLEAGGVLEYAHIAFHTSQPEWDGRRRVVWICHPLTSDSNPEQWWPGLVGPGKAVDTERDFVVCINYIGSPFGSECAASVNPATGKPWLLDFPRVTCHDSVAAAIEVRKALGIDHIDLLLCPSCGGFLGIDWAIEEHDLFRRCVFMATAPRCTPYLSATMENQRMALEADPTFREAKDVHGGAAGLACARAQARLSYRSFESYGLSQAETDPEFLFATRVASYQRHQGEKFVQSGFDAYSFWSICNIYDSLNVGRGRGGLEKALAMITAQTTVLAMSTDQIFPPIDGEFWSALIPGADFHVIPTKYGHDGFLVEIDAIAPYVLRQRT